MIKNKLSRVKNQIKEHAPEIIFGAVAIAATAYAIALRGELSEERLRLPKKGVSRLALNDCCFEELKNGEPVIWDLDGYKIDLAYDPDC